jgi:hypothetical protein
MPPRWRKKGCAVPRGGGWGNEGAAAAEEKEEEGFEESETHFSAAAAVVVVPANAAEAGPPLPAEAPPIGGLGGGRGAKRG